METFSALLALCAGNSPVPVNSPHKGQWRGALMFSLIYAWINDWVNNRETGDLKRQRGHYDVIVMRYLFLIPFINIIVYSSNYAEISSLFLTSFTLTFVHGIYGTCVSSTNVYTYTHVMWIVVHWRSKWAHLIRSSWPSHIISYHLSSSTGV